MHVSGHARDASIRSCKRCIYQETQERDASTRRCNGGIPKLDLRQGASTRVTWRQGHRWSPFSRYVTVLSFVALSQRHILYAKSAQFSLVQIKSVHIIVCFDLFSQRWLSSLSWINSSKVDTKALCVFCRPHSSDFENVSIEEAVSACVLVCLCVCPSQAIHRKLLKSSSS